jgi:sugar phosphate isomerase/epimerase
MQSPTSMIQFAFSSNAFKRTSLEEAIGSIASCGYSGVEIMADIPHAYPPHTPPERIASVKSQLRTLRLGISNINAFTLFAIGDTYRPTWIDPDPALRKQRISHTAACIDMASELGARTISLQPGGPVVGQPADSALDMYAQGITELLPQAQRRGIILTVEPEPGLLIETSQQCREFIARIDHPHLRMNADLGHFFCVGEDPAAVIESCADIIAHVHVEDIAANRVHQHLIPGQGAMDFDSIFAALAKVGYQGWITVELYPYETTADEAALQAMKFLQKYI